MLENLNTQFLTEKQVAAITGFSLSSLQKQRFYSRGIPYYKVGRSVRYLLREIEEFMNKHKVNLDN